MEYDCFFSYQHDDLSLIESIVEELEMKGLKCWYAPRNVTGRYAKAIAEGINSSKVFILVLNHRSATSEAVLNEIELAHNVSKNSPNAVIQPLCVEKIDMDAPEYQEIMYYIRRMHFINAYENESPATIAYNIIKTHEYLIMEKKSRTKSEYISQDIEDKRLNFQNDLLKKFDDDVYKGIISQYIKPNILDVGCGQGDMLISKLKDIEVSSFVGLDKSTRQIQAAKTKHNDKGYYFAEVDVEQEKFEEILTQVTKLCNIDKFEIINISMLLLHIKDPNRLLIILHHFLSNDGTIIIRDIDDGINFAFPDQDNTFERIYGMCARDEQSGNRTNGRQVYTALYNSGFSHILLERQGLSSIGLTQDERETLFNMYFPFTLKNAEIMMNKYSWNLDYKKDFLWYKENFDKIHKDFLNESFVFSLGFMTYTAKK